MGPCLGQGLSECAVAGCLGEIGGGTAVGLVVDGCFTYIGSIYGRL